VRVHRSVMARVCVWSGLAAFPWLETGTGAAFPRGGMNPPPGVVPAIAAEPASAGPGLVALSAATGTSTQSPAGGQTISKPIHKKTWFRAGIGALVGAAIVALAVGAGDRGRVEPGQLPDFPAPPVRG
jgi:hypothetical protein